MSRQRWSTFKKLSVFRVWYWDLLGHWKSLELTERLHCWMYVNVSGILLSMFTFIWVLISLFRSPQSHSDSESQRSVMEKEEPRCSPSPPSTPSICSPTSSTSASSVPPSGKNVCASCGLEILDRYLLKVGVSTWIWIFGRTKQPAWYVLLWSDCKSYL